MAAELVGADGTQLLQQLERAKARVEEIRRHLEGAEHAIARTINGQDGEGAVEIVLGADGNVEAVHLDPDWRDLVDEQGLPAAVTEAYRAAHGSRLSDWCGALRESLGARGWIPMALRVQPEGPDAPQLLGPDPDLSSIGLDLSDEQVAAEVRAALHRATGAGTHAAGTAEAAPVPAQPGAVPPEPGQLREQVAATFGDLSVAIDAAPAWLDITLVVTGAQTVLDMLREVTEPLLPTAAGTSDSQVRLTGGLDAAVLRARSLLGIPEGLRVALGAVTDFVTAAGPGPAGGR